MGLVHREPLPRSRLPCGTRLIFITQPIAPIGTGDVCIPSQRLPLPSRLPDLPRADGLRDFPGPVGPERNCGVRRGSQEEAGTSASGVHPLSEGLQEVLQHEVGCEPPGTHIFSVDCA